MQLRQDIDNFVNKLRYHILKTVKKYVKDNPPSTSLSVEAFQLDNSPVTSKSFNMNFRREKTNVNSIEIFTELVEKDLF